MKFFEFNSYEYYALILAKTMEKAMMAYDEEVACIEEEEKDLKPDEITLESALLKYKKGNIEGCESEEEKIEDFYQNITNFEKYVSNGTEQYVILLVDGSLM